MMKTLTEKIAFVTGGTRGMGEAIVRRLAAEGASVVFTYVSSEEKAKKLTYEIEQQGGASWGSRQMPHSAEP
jgi:3-oxoacyl-[acyl-carrier protein] reductase